MYRHVLRHVYRGVNKRVRRHVYRDVYRRSRAAVCGWAEPMRIGSQQRPHRRVYRRVQRHVHRYVYKQASRLVYRHVHYRPAPQTCVQSCVQTSVQTCVQTCVYNVYRHVYRHACRHVYVHVYGRVSPKQEAAAAVYEAKLAEQTRRTQVSIHDADRLPPDSLPIYIPMAVGRFVFRHAKQRAWSKLRRSRLSELRRAARLLDRKRSLCLCKP